MPITIDAQGKFSGEGWVTGGFMGPVWVTASGWTWFPNDGAWRYMPFMMTGGPTWEAWEAAGRPVFAPEPSSPPQTGPVPSEPMIGPDAASPSAPAAESGSWDGTGWVEHDGDLVYKPGDRLLVCEHLDPMRPGPALPLIESVEVPSEGLVRLLLAGWHYAVELPAEASVVVERAGV